ncbi:hypothetical protein CCR75_006799 [Bremia lactucae]|uniref:Uncharacterized protein n=1 Tax=Bremia lactucae TaxID=4779 RepID=A0A976IEA3_BRELC|nr:hypothetical protein CCR75_006799 [Bremia lactucae]
MGADGCQCADLEKNEIVRQQRWRELCAKFYYNQDETAKRVLYFFEASKVDEISISAVEETGVDEQFNEAVKALGLRRCMVPGHDDYFAQTPAELTDACAIHRSIHMLEMVKNDVRSGYHEHYAKFNAHAKESQGTSYELWTDETARQQLKVIVQHEYVRTIESRTNMMERFVVFTEKHASNVGSHPFLAGLRASLQWNLESSTIVAWKLSDSVFVESGDSEFTHNALALLVRVLNFSHCESTAIQASKASNKAKIRDWYLDPYLSDQDIRQIIRLIPAAKRLEGNPTGTKLVTRLDRLNVHGQRDERSRFFNRWCVLL